jgi:chemotaxis protein methyltransferase CheR
MVARTDNLGDLRSSMREFPDDPEASDIRLLLDTLYERAGADFRSYAYSSLKRRMLTQVGRENVGSISGLQKMVVRDTGSMERLITSLTIHVTAMFRDPSYYRVLREEVIPVARTYPFLRLWVAGCSTGEEVYSLAILLQEEGLYSRCRIYATDLNENVLQKARRGIFPLGAMQEYTRNYQRAGGQRSFAEYYTADNEYAILRPELRDNVVFAAHNLVGDASFNEFHGIFCRNVMIYFNRTLQERVHRLFYDSLLTFGYLGLGRSETIRFTPHAHDFEEVSAREKLFRKIR